MPRYTAALDTSGAAALAIAIDGIVRRHSALASIGRGNDQDLVPWIVEELKLAGTTPAAIAAWTCGLGPGSFSGVRVGIAWVKGVCAASGALYRGVPSSLAIASAVHRQTGAADIGVLHDGRRRQLILSRGHFSQGECQLQAPEVVDLEHLTAAAGPCLLATAQPDLLALLPSEMARELTVLPGIPAEELLLAPGKFPATAAECDASCDPIYVRPPVFVEPKTPGL